MRKISNKKTKEKTLCNTKMTGITIHHFAGLAVNGLTYVGQRYSIAKTPHEYDMNCISVFLDGTDILLGRIAQEDAKKIIKHSKKNPDAILLDTKAKAENKPNGRLFVSISIRYAPK
jgi:hypothetical protein